MITTNQNVDFLMEQMQIPETIHERQRKMVREEIDPLRYPIIHREDNPIDDVIKYLKEWKEKAIKMGYTNLRVENHMEYEGHGECYKTSRLFVTGERPETDQEYCNRINNIRTKQRQEYEHAKLIIAGYKKYRKDELAWINMPNFHLTPLPSKQEINKAAKALLKKMIDEGYSANKNMGCYDYELELTPEHVEIFKKAILDNYEDKNDPDCISGLNEIDEAVYNNKKTMNIAWFQIFGYLEKLVLGETQC